jgi:predicted ATP-dependent endonuclease of OLD family
MKIVSITLTYIKAFKSLTFDLERTSVLVGQNDHGKSSVLKILDIVLNQITDETLDRGVLEPDVSRRLLPLFPVNAKARRITINYQDSARKERQLHITIKTDQTFTVLQTIKRGAQTTQESLKVLRELRKRNRLVLIPALRDASSKEFQNTFSRLLRSHGLDSIVTGRVGGKSKEYRTLKSIRDAILRDVKPYVDDALIPKIKEHFGFDIQHRLALTFNASIHDIGNWMLDNLQLGFELTGDDGCVLPLAEAGSGVQSGVLLALQRLEREASKDPSTQFILAIEEPEAFLHPHKQKELYRNIRNPRTDNLRIIITTHSPYIVSETPFEKLGLIKKDGQYSALHIADSKDANELEIFNSYCTDVNAQLFFADKILLVEGDSDARVLRVLLEKSLGSDAHRISIISASGNRNFSPFLRMIKAWTTAKIPHLVVTDFDSLTKETDRAILEGIEAAGYRLPNKQALHKKIDEALSKGETEYTAAATDLRDSFKSAGINVFVFTSDLEHALITPDNEKDAAQILTDITGKKNNYTTGYTLSQLRQLIGSKGIPLNSGKDSEMKKPFIHKKIAETINLDKAHSDIIRLLEMIKTL